MALFKTKLEYSEYQDLNKMTAQDLSKVLANALKSSYKRMDRLAEAGYEDNYFNQRFRAMMGETADEAISKINDLDLNHLRQKAAYVKRHLASEESSLEGKARQEIRSLQVMDKLIMGDSDWTAPEIKKVKEGYVMRGRLYTKNELNEFWEIYHKANETFDGRTLRGDTNEALAIIINAVFLKGTKDPVKIAEMLRKQYNEEQNASAEAIARQEKRFEEIRKKNKQIYSSQKKKKK